MNREEWDELKAMYPKTDLHWLECLKIARENGADKATLDSLASAVMIRRADAKVILPQNHLQRLRFGRGWCRKGSGSDTQYGERTDNGDYRVGPGRWTVGGTEGSKKSSTTWVVEHVVVGGDVWTVVH